MEDIIYLEADSEITEAIDKLKNADGMHVKLVVPARSGLLQSAVNIKLLKKAAKDAKKELALITNDKTAKYLAGSLGIAVASNIKADPEVIERPEEQAPDIDEAAEVAAAAVATKAAKEKKSKKQSSDPDQPTGSATASGLATKQLDDTEPQSPDTPKKSKNNKIPNYGSFQKKLFIGLAIFLGFIAFVAIMNLLPKAKVTLAAQGEKKAVGFDFSIDSAQTSSNVAESQLAAKQLTASKEVSANVTATGKKDVGTKATGTIQLNNSASSSPVTLPAGTILSASGKNFSLNQSTTIPGASVSGGGIVAGKANGAITAAVAGDSYNLSGATFSITGQPPQVNGTGTTSGGTSKVITVLSQEDINKAKADVSGQNEDKTKQELNDKAGSSYTTFGDTFTKSVSSFNSSVAADSEATTASVNAKIDYSMLAVANDQLDALFNAQIKKDIKAGTDIYQNGRADATYKVKTKDATSAKITTTSNAYVGAKIDKDQLAHDLAGKSKKDASSIVKAKYPSIQTVTVGGMPFWPWLPMLSSHITIDIQVLTN